MSDIVPPSDVDTERALIGHMLYVNKSSDLDLTGLAPSHFFDPIHGSIWNAIRKLDSENQPFDPVSVASHLNAQQKLAEIGGTAKLAEIGLGAAVLGEVSIIGHSKRLISLWRARQFIGACQTGSAEMLSGGQVDEIILRYDQILSDLLSSNSSTGPERFFEVVEETMRKLRSTESRATSIGFPSIDNCTGGGMHPGELIIVAGRPGMGKTAFLLNSLTNITSRHQNSACAMFSLEMPTMDLATRVLCSESKIPMSEIRSGRVKDEHWSGLTNAVAKLANIPLWIDDTSSLTVYDIRSRIRAIKRDLFRLYGNYKKLAGVGIDYLQLMRGDRSPNREQEVSSITRGLKALAKDEEVWIMALSQLNRGTENQSNKRPGLKDLRESGAIEQDADAVAFIFRLGYYDDTVDQSEGEFIIAKQRNGPTTTVPMHWDPIRMRYSDLDKTHEYLEEVGEMDYVEDWN